MLPKVLITLLSLFGVGYTSESTNEVIIAPSSTKSPINLDTNLRKALLKALVELENEERENHQRETRNDYVNIITHLDSKDKTVEKASASSVSFFSRPEPVNMTITVKKTTSKPKQSVFIQKSNGVSHKTIEDFEDLNLSESPEQIIASASNSIASAKSENSKIKTGGAQLNSLVSKEKSRKTKLEQTTTIKPTTSTEESEATVESLQFFSAPLVAAFTVHQDEKGLPKSVVPIYNQANNVINNSNDQKEQLKNHEELEREVSKQKKELEARQEEELRTKQLQLKEEIERLTKVKEEQERLIREQKLIYEEKLLEHQKKLFEEQRRLFNNVQPFLSIPAKTTTPKPIINNFRGTSPNTGTLVAIQPSVGFVPSSVKPVPSFLPQNAQILPIKNPVDFKTPYPQVFGRFKTIPPEPSNNFNSLSSFSRAQSTVIPSISFSQNAIVPSFSTTQNSVVPLENNAQNLGIFQNLPSTQNSIFHQVPPNQNIFAASQQPPFQSPQNIPFRSLINNAPTHGTRSLRQESGTGNFLNNNRFSAPDISANFFGNHRLNTNSFAFNQVPQISKSNFGFNNPNNLNQYQYNTLQYSVDQPFLKQRFNNLLSHTGLGQGEQQENLNIVSNVLSLNHLGTDSQSINNNEDLKRIRNSGSWRVV